jgi:demethylmenaquinone methyltransferase/2-methoxy-6-polyprenyl-1,4-benzoquinol methylase
MVDPNKYISSLLRNKALVEPIAHSAIQALNLSQESQGLDAGCGIGLQAIMLAKAVGPSGTVTGLYVSPELLSYGKKIVKECGLVNRITFITGDVRELPFENNRFDWAWSSDCVGYGPWEPVPLVKELSRVVKPGGIVTILAWSSQMLLPGYPLLEARLNATSAGIAPFIQVEKPETHFMFGLKWFREANLEVPDAQTFVSEVYSPLTDEVRQAMIDLFGMRWSGVEAELAPEDKAEYHRLCMPQSPDFILNHPDYYAFFTYSMFRGRVASKTSTPT